jgi:hypothetical protein
MLPYLIQGFAGATNCGKPPVESKEKILEVKDFDCISQLHSGQKKHLFAQMQSVTREPHQPTNLCTLHALFEKHFAKKQKACWSHVLDSHRRHQCLLGNVEK